MCPTPAVAAGNLIDTAPSTDVDFSLVLGGPLYQLLQATRLSGEALDLLWRRIVFISLFCWLPLFVLSAIRGQLLGGPASVPFLLDVEVHVRFLVAAPLLVGAELLVHQRMRMVLQQFLSRRLIGEDARPRFDAAVASAMRLRNSVLAEVLLIAVVYGVGVFIVWRQYIAMDTTTWFTAADASGRLSPAGLWYGYVSMPVFQFLLLRWYFRMFIWARLLWQVSRIQLRLMPTHPDRVGGLAFISGTAYAFVPLAVAHGAVVAGFIANRIFHLGATLPQFKVEIGILVAFVELMVFGPLLVFVVQLSRAKRTGLREYGVLAASYVRQFDDKWVRGGATADDELLGSGDIQSLADLGNSFEVVRSMRLAPITRDPIVQVGVAALLPLAPLLLTMMPLEELLRRLFGIIF
jgi:hypothetical protein